MREWFDSLAHRERIIVVVGAVVVGIMLFWALVLAPLDSGVSRLSERVDDKRELIGWMQQAAARIKSAGPIADTGDDGGDQVDHLLPVIISPALDRITEIGKEYTRLNASEE